MCVEIQVGHAMLADERRRTACEATRWTMNARRSLAFHLLILSVPHCFASMLFEEVLRSSADHSSWGAVSYDEGYEAKLRMHLESSTVE